MCKIKESKRGKLKKMAKNLNLGNFFDDFKDKYLQTANFSEK